MKSIFQNRSFQYSTIFSLLSFATSVFLAIGLCSSQTLLADTISVEKLQSQIEATKATSALPEETKKQILTLYELAIADLRQADKLAVLSEQYASSQRTAPEDVGRTRYELSQLAQAALPVVGSEVSISILQEKLIEAEAELSEAKKVLRRLDKEPKYRATRRKEIPQQRISLREKLQQDEQTLKLIDKTNDPPELAAAKRVQLEASIRATQSAIDVGAIELKAYQATIDLLPLQRDVAANRVARLHKIAKTLQGELNRKRTTEVALHLIEAKEETNRNTGLPQFADLASTNLALVERRQELRQQIDTTNDALAAINSTATQLNQQQGRIRRKVEAVGLTGTIGLLMRKQKSELPRIDQHEREIDLRQQTLKTAQLALLELQDRRSDLANVENEMNRLITQGKLPDEKQASENPRKTWERLLNAERRYVDLLLEDYKVYLEQLLALDEAQRQLAQDISSLTNFIDENVLWVRSTESMSSSSVAASFDGIRDFFQGGFLRQTWNTISADYAKHPLPFGLVAISLLSARTLGWQMTIRHSLPQSSAQRPSRYWRILRDLLRVALCAVPLPLFLAFAGQRLVNAGNSEGYERAVGIGLINVAICLLPLAVLIRLCRRKGFARRHLGWSAPGIAAMRRALFPLAVVVLPLILIMTTLNAQDDVRLQDSLGRLCYVVNVLVVALFSEQLLRPNSGILYRAAKPSEKTLLHRLRWPLYLVGVGAHLTLGVLAIVGYTYSAERLGQEVRSTFLLMACLFVVGSLLLHGSRLIARRRAIQTVARQRAATALSNREKESSEGTFPLPDTGDGWFVQLDKPEDKIQSLVTSLLVLVLLLGGWWIWSDVFPALHAVSNTTLWETEVITSQPSAPLGTESPAPDVRVPTLVPVTLGDLLLAMFVVISTVMASRYLDGLFELPVLDQLALDSSLRNSITTIARYTLWIAAAIFAAGCLGIGWGKVQWMAAALSLGLGFGLQEIFANFISGLIILFERPMRVGDVITIGDTTGVVQSIRMRATTITDWDRKDLVVPNKEFATGRLLNWTLQNKTNRRVIEVGVAYGSDPDQVRDLLLKVASENPRVLNSPKPVALLQQFGDSSLIFSLRVYHARIGDRLKGLHELNAAIAREFAAAGITIAFPQRDLHIHAANSASREFWFQPQQTNADGRETTAPSN